MNCIICGKPVIADGDFSANLGSPDEIPPLHNDIKCWGAYIHGLRKELAIHDVYLLAKEMIKEAFNGTPFNLSAVAEVLEKLFDDLASRRCTYMSCLHLLRFPRDKKEDSR